MVTHTQFRLEDHKFNTRGECECGARIVLKRTSKPIRHRPIVSEHPEGGVFIIGCMCGHTVCTKLDAYLKRMEFISTFGRLCDEDIEKIKAGNRIV